MSETLASSLEKVKGRLLEEARKEAQRIISQASAEAENTLKKAEEEWQRRFQEFMRAELKRARERAEQIESEARMKARLAVARAKSEMVERVFEEARKKLAGRELDVERSLRNLLTESLREVQNPVRVLVSPLDKETAERILAELGKGGVAVEVDANIAGGVIVEGEDGVLVDNTYETRLKLARERLANVISTFLWRSSGSGQ